MPTRKEVRIPTWPEETEVMIARAEEEIRETDCDDFGVFKERSEQCVGCPVCELCEYVGELRREEK
jgi:hypothetical protein